MLSISYQDPDSSLTRDDCRFTVEMGLGPEMSQECIQHRKISLLLALTFALWTLIHLWIRCREEEYAVSHLQRGRALRTIVLSSDVGYIGQKPMNVLSSFLIYFLLHTQHSCHKPRASYYEKSLKMFKVCRDNNNFFLKQTKHYLLSLSSILIYYHHSKIFLETSFL